MNVICIAGAVSGLGKTTLVTRLLHALPGWSACKVTACLGGRRHNCPRGKDDTCGVCASLDEDFEIEEEQGGPASAGKDTGRMREAGAARVLWVKARPFALAAAVRQALSVIEDCEGVIVEGNHALSVLEPDLAVMVVGADGRMKRSARAVVSKVNFFVRDIDEEGLTGRIVSELVASCALSRPDRDRVP